MTFLPVVERELRVAARRRGTYWGRFTAGVIGAVLAAWVLLAVEDTEKHVGAALLRVVSAVVFLYATVAGTLVTCDCLSEEKREGTLGLLFLTDLKGHDVVLGKLVATSVNAFYGMLAVLPMLAIPFIVGGVSRVEMLRVVLVSINLLFLFLSIGLFVSAVSRKDNWALGLSILIGLSLVAGGPILTEFRLLSNDTAMLSSPAAGCFLAFDDAYATGPGMKSSPHYYFWVNAAVTHLCAWIFFCLACWIVPRSWQDAAVGTKLLRSRFPINPSHRARIRAQLLNINPFLWRVTRSGRKGMLVWLLLISLALFFWKFTAWLRFSNFFEPGVDIYMLVPTGVVLKGWMAAEASRTFSQDRRSGGLELLLSTPMHERDIVRGQLAALWRQFGPPATVVLAVNLFFLIVELRRSPLDIRSDLLESHLLIGGFFAADMVALAWVGMWMGMTNHKPNRATLLALMRIVVLPGVIFVVAIALLALTRKNTDPDGTPVLVLWTIIGLAADIYFSLTARAALRRDFRTIVAEGLPQKAPAQPAPLNKALALNPP